MHVFNFSFPFQSPSGLYLCWCCSRSDTVMCLQGQHGGMCWNPVPLSPQKIWMFFIWDFISRTLKEPEAGRRTWKCSVLFLFPSLPLSPSSEIFSSHDHDAGVKGFSTSKPVRMPLHIRGHSQCKHGQPGNVYLSMTQWQAVHVSLCRLKLHPACCVAGWTSGRIFSGGVWRCCDVKHNLPGSWWSYI